MMGVLKGRKTKGERRKKSRDQTGGMDKAAYQTQTRAEKAVTSVNRVESDVTWKCLVVVGESLIRDRHPSVSPVSQDWPSTMY
jgi:hypothetical protein